MSILDTFLEIAEKEIGVSEYKNGENPRILLYDSTTTLAAKQDEVPWCSSFVNWVVTEAGLKGTNSAAAISWLKWGKPIKEPVPGCIAIFSRGKDKALGHVTFFKERVRDSLLWSCVGGNQNNQVNVSNFWPTGYLGLRVPLCYKD